MRVDIDKTAVRRIVDRNAAAGVAAAARFMADQQRSATSSSRVSAQVGHESGRDAAGWYARAGMREGTRRSAGWFWYFHEYQTGKGPPGVPFLRQSLFSHGRKIARLMLGSRL